MEKRKKKNLIIFASIIIVLSNVPVLNNGLFKAFDTNKIRYSNIDGSYTRIDKFHLKSTINKSGVDLFVKTDVERLGLPKEKIEVYRLYRMNPLYFWRWSFYLIISKDFKYKSWSEIEPNRVPYVPLGINESYYESKRLWQDF